ncbi:TonB family protein [Sphingomonas daechungensis]|uniref:TonB family protein n=1 Tax=Sphingomonas daechungensis TaxID=1176646 RepID=UPI003784DEC0
MIWLLAIAEIGAAEPKNSNWLSPQDTPTRVMPSNVVQSVGIGVTVTPEGKFQSCTVEKSSGNSLLDQHTCKIVQRRARFRPAVDLAGSAAYGVYRVNISWYVGDGLPPPSFGLPDAEVRLSTAPPKTRLPLALIVKFVVDEQGRMSNCAGAGKKANPELVTVACDQILKSYRATPARTAYGVAVPSVQSGTVLFRSN